MAKVAVTNALLKIPMSIDSKHFRLANPHLFVTPESNEHPRLDG